MSAGVDMYRVEDCFREPEATLADLQRAAFKGCTEDIRGKVWRVLFSVDALHGPEVSAEDVVSTYRKLLNDCLHSGVLDAVSARSPMGAEEGGSLLLPAEPEADAPGVIEPAQTTPVRRASLSASRATSVPRQVQLGQDPLSTPAAPARAAPTSKAAAKAVASKTWEDFHSDVELAAEIRKDVTRTMCGMHWFQDEQRAALERVLLLRAKLTPGVSYVQGMNEVAAPLLHVHLHEPGADPDLAEARSFHVFNAILTELQDMYTRELDVSATGIHGTLAEFAALMQRLLPDVAAKMQELGVTPEFYAVEWFTTLFTRAFNLPDSLLLWDTLFADPSRFKHLQYVALGIVHMYEPQILDGDFASIIMLLQRPEQPLAAVLAAAQALRARDNHRSKPSSGLGSPASWFGSLQRDSPRSSPASVLTSSATSGRAQWSPARPHIRQTSAPSATSFGAARPDRVGTQGKAPLSTPGGTFAAAAAKTWGTMGSGFAKAWSSMAASAKALSDPPQPKAAHLVSSSSETRGSATPAGSGSAQEMSSFTPSAH